MLLFYLWILGAWNFCLFWWRVVPSSSLTLNFISLSLAAPSSSCSSSIAWCYQAIIPQVRSQNEVIEMKTLIAKVAPLQEVRTEKAKIEQQIFGLLHSHLVLTQSKFLQTLLLKPGHVKMWQENNSDVFMCWTLYSTKDQVWEYWYKRACAQSPAILDTQRYGRNCRNSCCIISLNWEESLTNSTSTTFSIPGINRS